MHVAYLLIAALASPVPNGGVLDNDTDPDGDAIVSAVLVTPPESGTLDFRPDGTFAYTPAQDYLGAVVFSYAPVDETGMEGDPTPVTITVEAVGSPPVGVPDSYRMDENTTLEVPTEVVFTGPAYKGSALTARPNSRSEAKWSFEIAKAGLYEVSATWPPATTAATDSPFRVFVNGQVRDTVRVDQQRAPDDFAANGGTWERLAQVEVGAGGTIVVLLGDDANGLVVADAIRIERLGDDADDPETVPAVSLRSAVTRTVGLPDGVPPLWAPVVPEPDAVERRVGRDE